MNKDVENRSKEIFEEAQAKQARYVKRILLGTLCGIGFVFAVLGTVFIAVGDLYGEMGIVYLSMGLVFIVLGVILYFVIPTKYNYEKYSARAKKYGVMNIYAINAKVAELEARIEELEKRNGD